MIRTGEDEAAAPKYAHIERERRSGSANLAVGIEAYVKAPR